MGEVHRGYLLQVSRDGVQPYHPPMAAERCRRELLLYGLPRQDRDEEP